MSGGNTPAHAVNPMLGLMKNATNRAIDAREYMAADCTIASTTFQRSPSRADSGIYWFVLRSTRHIMRAGAKSAIRGSHKEGLPRDFCANGNVPEQSVLEMNEKKKNARGVITKEGVSPR